MSKVIEIIDSDDDINTSPDTTSNSINNMDLDDNQQSQSRRRRRKSVLHAMTDPDMQFQTISLEDDDDEDDINSTIQSNIVQGPRNNTLTVGSAPLRTFLKTPRTTPKILAPRAPTNEELIEANYEKFLNDPETISDIYAIAGERARINNLLSLNGMPEINFALYTRPDRLQFQFEERLKQRKMVNNWDSTRIQDNRRSLLQKNSEQQSTL